MVVCLERGADLHLVQLMPLPLTVSCFSKIQIGFSFLIPAHMASAGKRAVKHVCVCVCVCAFVRVRVCVNPGIIIINININTITTKGCFSHSCCCIGIGTMLQQQSDCIHLTAQMLRTINHNYR